MNSLPFVSLIAVLAYAIGAHAADIRLINGTILQDAKILSATADALNIFHDGKITTIGADKLSPESKWHLSKENRITEAPKNLGFKLLTPNEPLYHSKGDFNTIARLSGNVNSTVIDRIGRWKKVQIALWVFEEDATGSTGGPSLRQ